MAVVFAVKISRGGKNAEKGQLDSLCWTFVKMRVKREKGQRPEAKEENKKAHSPMAGEGDNSVTTPCVNLSKSN